MAELTSAVFDLDGTLLSSGYIWDEVDRVFLERRGIPLPWDYIDQMNRLPFDLTARYTKERFSLPDDEKSIYEEWNELAIEEYGKVPLKEGAQDLLEYLSQKGFELFVATDLDSLLYDSALEGNEISRHFKAVFSSRDIGKRKSDVEYYKTLLQKIGRKGSEVIYFEDLPYALKAAGMSGITTVGIQDDTTSRSMEEINAVADFAYYSISDAFDDIESILSE